MRPEVTACKNHEFRGNVKGIWQELGGDEHGMLELHHFAPDAAKVAQLRDLIFFPACPSKSG